MTSAPGIFAGGDCVFGPRLIIDSVADGKRAAIGYFTQNLTSPLLRRIITFVRRFG